MARRRDVWEWTGTLGLTGMRTCEVWMRRRRRWRTVRGWWGREFCKRWRIQEEGGWRGCWLRGRAADRMWRVESERRYRKEMLGSKGRTDSDWRARKPGC